MNPRLFFPILIILFATACTSGGAALVPAPVPTSSPMSTVTAAPVKTTAPLVGKIRILKPEGSDSKDIPFFLAMDALAAQGIMVEQSTVANSTLAAAALARGDADIASLNNQTMWSAILKGAPVRTIMQRYVTTTLLVSSKDIQDCSGLNGKKVGMTTTSGLSPALVKLYLEQHCPGTEIEIAVISDNAGRVTALNKGEIGAASLDLEDIFHLEQITPGKYHILITLNQEFPKVQSSGIHVRTDWAEQNPELLKAFIRAILTSYRAADDNPSLVVAEAIKRFDLQPEIARNVVDKLIAFNMWNPNGGLNEDNIQYTLDFLGTIKTLPEGVKVQDVADLSYLNAVLDEMGRR